LGQIPKHVVEISRGAFFLTADRSLSSRFSFRLIPAPFEQRLRHFWQTRTGLARRERAIIGSVMAGI
jgi:hypothetical protein